MSPPANDDTTDDSRRGRGGRGREVRTTGDEFSRWVAESALRIALTLVGLVLLVYALGRAVGVDLLAIVVDALLSPVGRWIVVAFFALLLIVVAQRGFQDRA